MDVRCLEWHSAHGKGPTSGSCYFSASEKYPRFDGELDRNTGVIELFSA